MQGYLSLCVQNVIVLVSRSVSSGRVAKVSILLWKRFVTSPLNNDIHSTCNFKEHFNERSESIPLQMASCFKIFEYRYSLTGVVKKNDVINFCKILVRGEVYGRFALITSLMFFNIFKKEKCETTKKKVMILTWCCKPPSLLLKVLWWNSWMEKLQLWEKWFCFSILYQKIISSLFWRSYNTLTRDKKKT